MLFVDDHRLVAKRLCESGCSECDLSSRRPVGGYSKSVIRSIEKDVLIFDRLSLDLDKSAKGEGTVMLRLQGNNPAVLSGRPFDVNVRVDSNFDRLADTALLSVRSEPDMLRRAAGRAGA